jgi:hypothetical protein
MKVLYLGYFTEGAGWATASENYVRALQAAGVEVVARPIVIHGRRKPSDDILKLFDKPVGGSTHVIQHTFPSQWDYSSKMKNVGLFVTETDNITYTHWENKIKCMDQVWVPNADSALQIKGVTHVVHHAADVSVYDKEWVKPQIPMIEDRLVFYFIGENIRRKRINGILSAYNAAFDINDRVVLIIKTGREGQPPEQTADEINQSNIAVKKGLRLYANRDLYPEIIIIPNNLPIEQLYGLHQTADCFVNATFGDAWNQPCFDALGFGNTIISPIIGGMKEYLFGAIKKYPVNYSMETCFGADPFLPDLHTGRERWYSVQISDLTEMMKVVYANYLREGKSKVEQHKNRAKQFSYEVVGDWMRKCLDA